jgi:phage-related protein
VANKNVNILLKLQDQFTRPMREAGKITKEQERAMHKCSSSVMGFSKKVRSGFGSAIKHVGLFGAALAGIGGVLSVAGIKSFCDDAIAGFNAATEAETKLEAVLGNVPSIMAKGTGEAAKAKERLVALTDKLEETGAVAGDVTVAGLQQLATFQLTEASLSKLAPGMADLVAQQKGLNATQGDAVSIGNLIGKAMTGQTGALSKAGIIMSDYQAKVMKSGTESERAAMMAKILEQNVGGVNAALAQTDAGKIAVTQNLLGRASDEIGGKLMHIKAQIYGFSAQYIPDLQSAAIAFLDKLEPKIEAGLRFLAAHSDQIKSAIAGVKDGVVAVWHMIEPVLGFAVQHANVLIPAILGVVGAISGLSIVVDIAGKIMNLVDTVKQVVSTVKMVGSALSALTGGPAVWIMTAISLLVVGLVYAYQHSEKFRNAVNKLGNGIKTVFTKIVDAVKALKDKFVGAFQAIRDKVSGIVQKIREFLQPLIDLIDKIKSGLKNLGFGSSANTGSQYSLTANGGKATGTPYWKGGPTHINEGGRGEIVNLPSGTQIIPHDVAKQQKTGPSIVVNLTVQGNVIGNRQFMEATGQYITQKILAAQGVV